MDDKLRELQQELSALEAAPEPRRIARVAPEASAPGAVEPLPPPDRAALPLAAAAADQARAIIADAQAEATRIVNEAAGRVSAIATQIDDLERLRGELERSARALVDEYAAALPNLERPTAAQLESLPPRRTEVAPSSVHPPLW